MDGAANGTVSRPSTDRAATPRWPSRLIALTAAAGLAASLAVNWPGHFSVDSVSQLAQGRDGLYDDWHPPIMAWLLGVADRLTPRAVGFFVGDTVLFFAGLLIFAVAERRPRPIAALVLAAVAVSPQALVFQGMVWKDLLFADTTLGAFAALALAGWLWDAPGRRAASLAAAFVLFLVAGLARQTGFVAPLAGAATFVAIALAKQTSPRRAVIAATAALAAMALLAAGVGYGFSLRYDGEPGATAELAMLQTFDLAGADHLDRRLPLPVTHVRDPLLEWFIRGEAGPHYRPDIDYLDDLPVADVALPPMAGAVGEDWRRLILERPWLYLAARARVFWTTLATPESQSCPTISVGVQTDDKIDLQRAGLVLRKTRQDDWDEAYVFGLIGTPVLSHLFWGALALVLLAVGVRDVVRGGDRRPASLAVLGLLVTAVVFVASFLVISVACDYRYLYLLDAAAMAAAVRRAAAGPRSLQSAPSLQAAQASKPERRAPGSRLRPMKTRRLSRVSPSRQGR